jgi:hypothetical protein
MELSWAEWYAYGSFSLAGRQARQTLFRLLSSKQQKTYEDYGYFEEKNNGGKIRFCYGSTWNMEVGGESWHCQMNPEAQTKLFKSRSIPIYATIPIEDFLTTQLLWSRCRGEMQVQVDHAGKSVDAGFSIYMGGGRFVEGFYNKKTFQITASI